MKAGLKWRRMFEIPIPALSAFLLFVQVVYIHEMYVNLVSSYLYTLNRTQSLHSK